MKTHSSGSSSPCPTCGERLELHQPDPDLPDRMLGTCDACLTWCLIDGDARVFAVLTDEGVGRASSRRPSDRPTSTAPGRTDRSAGRPTEIAGRFVPPGRLPNRPTGAAPIARRGGDL